MFGDEHLGTRSNRLKALVQRVSEAVVTVGDQTLGAVGSGLVVFVGVGRTDGPDQARRLADKVAALRVFDDERGRMDRSLQDLGNGAAALCISQFTLYADTRKGLRPSFTEAAAPEPARALYETFCCSLAEHGVRVETGEFGARMAVRLTNDGPVTLLLET